VAGGFRSGGFSMTNVRKQSRQMWISRNIDSMLFVVFCPLQPGQVSGVAQGSSVTIRYVRERSVLSVAVSR
jgi:hypothetical protein